MEDNEFKRKLSEVAEWIIPTEPVPIPVKTKRRGRKTNEEVYMELREKYLEKDYDGINPSVAPKIIKVKCQAVDCQDCGRHCENGRQTEYRLMSKPHKKLWRENCVTCGMVKNPYTNKFDLKISEACGKWNDFMRPSKGVYQSKGNLQRTEFKSNPMTVDQPSENKTVLENDQEIITFYHDRIKK